MPSQYCMGMQCYVLHNQIHPFHQNSLCTWLKHLRSKWMRRWWLNASFLYNIWHFDNVCIHVHMVEGTSNRGVASGLLLKVLQWYVHTLPQYSEKPRSWEPLFSVTVCKWSMWSDWKMQILEVILRTVEHCYLNYTDRYNPFGFLRITDVSLCSCIPLHIWISGENLMSSRCFTISLNHSFSQSHRPAYWPLMFFCGALQCLFSAQSS